MKTNTRLLVYSLLSGMLMSIPWLVDGCGWVSLFGFLPLLLAEDIALKQETKNYFLFHYLTFVTWNALTTFWVCNATFAGGLFAILANALQMSVIFAAFHYSRKKMRGTLPYIFLAAMWIAWERAYFSAQISWPWLVLGNALARNIQLAQWYEYTGVLGGSVWIWACNISLFGVLCALADGIMPRCNKKALAAIYSGLFTVIAFPVAASLHLYHHFEEKSEDRICVLVGQPNYDSYEKFGMLPQEAQTCGLLALFDEAMTDSCGQCLLLAPETFTNDIVLNNVQCGKTFKTFDNYLNSHPGTEIIYGASSYEMFFTYSSPSRLARSNGPKCWTESHNSALLQHPDSTFEICHKSKLVVGTESTPFPSVFVPIDDFLCKLTGSYAMMGRCIGQGKPTVLNYRRSIPLGCAICYESVFGEYCTEYVRQGAKAMTIITNDVWWGKTPGYVQHCNFARLRAIELRRDIARCANTGISCFINQRGDITAHTEWDCETVLCSDVNLNSEETFFVRHGDITGRCCTFLFLLLAAYLLTQIAMNLLSRRKSAGR